MIVESEMNMNYLVCPTYAMHLKRETFSYFSFQNRHIPPIPSGLITDLHFKHLVLNMMAYEDYS